MSESREPAAPVARPGSQSALRRSNQQRIVDALLAAGASTQAELSRRTGLSSATISNLVRSMVGEGVVETSPTTSSGRRALSVRLRDDGSYAVGIDFGRRHLRVVVATTGHTVVAERFVELEPGYGAEDGMRQAAELLAGMLADRGIPDAAVLGAGIGIPGPIDRRSGRVAQGTVLPEWIGVDLAALGQHLGFPVFFDNDANLGALAEIAWGPHGAVDDLVFVKVGTGIGAGLVLDGRLHRGSRGVTGEFGHATMVEHGVVCRCGNRGCLETVASTATMRELLSRPGGAPVTTADIVALARAGDPAALRVLDDAGAAIGRALAGIANLVNPEVIVIGGPLSGLGEIVSGPLRRALARYALPIVAEHTVVAMSSLGERAESLGAASLVLSRPIAHRAPARDRRVTASLRSGIDDRESPGV